MTGGAVPSSAEASGERAVAAGGTIGSVNTGDFVTQVEKATLLPPEALAITPAGLVHLPERTQLFVGRARELALLDEGVGVQVLCGLGGIGKSTLAARWAADRVAGHSVVWWITAETPAELDAGLAGLARAMQPGVVGVLPEDALRERALQWLATHDDWLLVLDNVSAPADLRPLLARVGDGRIVVTSRRASGWQDVARTVVLDVLSPGEAAELFRGVCAGAAEQDGLDELCAELGYLPLALKQASAYCAEAGITPRAYLGLLAEYPGEMFAATAEGGEAARTLARVWQVTLERLRDTPLAVSVLQVIAWWAPEDIPRRFLDPLGTPLEVTEAVRRLAAHSMITLGGGMLSVHRLVQAVVRADQSEATNRARGSASALLLLSLPEGKALGDRHVAVHAEALAGLTDPGDDDQVAAEVFLQAATFLGTVTAFGRSQWLGERALQAMRRLHGPDHTRTMDAAQVLAIAAGMTGSGTWVPAELLSEGLASRLSVFGPDHPGTLSTRRYLARALLASEPERAEELLRENVAHTHRVLGPRHSESIRARYDLILGSDVAARDVAELEKLCADAEKASPEDPALCGTIKRTLVLRLSAAGETERALALAEEAAEESLRVHGDADTRTFISRLLLVHALTQSGRVEQARLLGRAVLEECLRTVGEGELARLVRMTVR
ncbi:tetratricopeptide repeat protein [Streptomyces sp. NPDC015130]|uniref:tetratricopeptide repeat protein n=1 Tax=Streptomyces sp. NPDC015130 TaxID=3364940 RepID=UPI0037009F19